MGGPEGSPTPVTNGVNDATDLSGYHCSASITAGQADSNRAEDQSHQEPAALGHELLGACVGMAGNSTHGYCFDVRSR